MYTNDLRATMYTNDYWGQSANPVKPKTPGGNWLSDFARQGQSMQGGNAMQNYYNPQNSYYFKGAGGQSREDTYQPQDLMQRYMDDRKNYSESARPAPSATSHQPQATVSAATNQLAQLMHPQAGPGYAAVNYSSQPETSFYDEGGEEFKIKKQPKPAYDWSMDFG